VIMNYGTFVPTYLRTLKPTVALASSSDVRVNVTTSLSLPKSVGGVNEML